MVDFGHFLNRPDAPFLIMKRYLCLILGLLFLALAGSVSRAQTFGSGTTVYGTTNSAPIQTNTFFITVPSKSVLLSQVYSTNEIFVGSYNLQFPGTTALYPIASFTNTFSLPGGTNNGTWSTNIFAATIQVPVNLIMQGQISNAANNVTYTNQLYVP